MSNWIPTRTVLLAASIGGLLALAAYWFFPSQKLLVAELERDTSQVPQAEVPNHLRQLAQLGDPGLQALVTALGSDRPEVSESAAQLLKSLLEEWRALPTDQSSVHVFRLAKLLAERAVAFGPTARRHAHQFASQILLWPIDRAVIDGTELVHHCEATLRVPASTVPVFERVTRPEVDELLADLQGGAAVDSPVGDPDVGQTQEPEFVDVLAVPRRVMDVAPGATPGPTREPAPIRNATPLDRESRPLEDRPTRSPVGSRSEGRGSESTAEVDQFSEQRPLNQLDDLAVIRALRAKSTAMAHSAQEELSRRGYQPLDIQLAWQLTNPDPQARVRFAEVLPELAGIDSRPWLLWLTYDQAPVVRRAAAGLLGTSNDPMLRQRLQELEREETDPYVLQQVRRSLKAFAR